MPCVHYMPLLLPTVAIYGGKHGKSPQRPWTYFFPSHFRPTLASTSRPHSLHPGPSHHSTLPLPVHACLFRLPGAIPKKKHQEVPACPVNIVTSNIEKSTETKKQSENCSWFILVGSLKNKRRRTSSNVHVQSALLSQRLNFSVHCHNVSDNVSSENASW